MYIDAKKLLRGKKVVLASASPRRRELMRLLTDEFEVIPAAGEERAPDKMRAEEIPIFLAEQKCREVAARCGEDAVVIGCDTVVIHDGCILGKPSDEADALAMLTKLAGDTHIVVSGLCVCYGGKALTGAGVTEVSFYPADRRQLLDYIATGEPMDKAGAYGIQGIGGFLVKGISGDYNSVVGLPVNELARLIMELMEND